MSQFRRPHLGEDFGYTPGEQPQGDGWLKLNTNESPLPPAPGVRQAVATAASALNLYPSPDGEPLRSALAQHHAVTPRQVMVAGGADAVLDCCFRAFAAQGGRVAYGTPTYSLFPVLARLHGAEAVELELAEISSVAIGIEEADADLTLIVNPNSPTGSWSRPVDLVEHMHGARGVVVIDEAYCDFAPESVIPYLAGLPNWIVVRTFSKSYALAGLRAGCAVGAPDLIADLRAVADSYPISATTLAGAGAALEDRAHHARIVNTVKEQRTRLTNALREQRWDVLHSQANFVYARPAAAAAGDILDELRRQRILVRHLGGDRLRITVGTAAQTDRLLEALRIPVA
jgi:histidinol-phosphate aminotransferase